MGYQSRPNLPASLAPNSKCDKTMRESVLTITDKVDLDDSYLKRLKIGDSK